MEAEEKAPPAPVPVAVSPFYAKLAEVDAAVKDVAPQFGCYDQTDPKSCQQNWSATTDEGTFITHDWGDGTHIRCFRPPGIDDYMACGDGKNISGEITTAPAGSWLRPLIRAAITGARAAFSPPSSSLAKQPCRPSSIDGNDERYAYHSAIDELGVVKAQMADGPRRKRHQGSLADVLLHATLRLSSHVSR